MTSGTATVAARQATATIPIVSPSVNPRDPTQVASLARPGGNVTGLTTLTLDLSAKRFDLAHELVPGASRVAILWPVRRAGAAASAAVRDTEAAARSRGVSLHAVAVTSPADFDGAFAAIAQARPAVLLVEPSSMFFGERERLARLAVAHRLPTVWGQREHAEAGGLVAYGTKLSESFRRAAVYVDKVLKGARPGDLPMEQPTTFELVVNLRTARALGLTIPQAVLVRADHVIE
jgi:putative ABC transport system substrate-binding protein